MGGRFREAAVVVLFLGLLWLGYEALNHYNRAALAIFVVAGAAAVSVLVEWWTR